MSQRIKHNEFCPKCENKSKSLGGLNDFIHCKTRI